MLRHLSVQKPSETHLQQQSLNEKHNKNGGGWSNFLISLTCINAHQSYSECTSCVFVVFFIQGLLLEMSF
jgi:hypothetical protein